MTPGIQFSFCDYSNPEHRKNLISLLNHYMTDPMGDSEPLSPVQQTDLLTGLSTHPSCFVLFAVLSGETIGLATCFINFSTFKAKSYINVHDLIVRKEHRGKGLGRKILEEIIRIGKERQYCKITLEVREDNNNAQTLYHHLGFQDCTPPMLFLTKKL